MTAAAAEAVTELTSPTLYCPALLLTAAAAEVPACGFAALGWGLVAALFVGVLPLLFLRAGARRGRWDNHHVADRERRLIPFLFTIGSVSAGIALLISGSAPRSLTALVAAMLAGLTVMLLISQIWKISVHAGTTAGGAIVLAAQLGVAGLVAGLLIAAAAGWSRVAVRDHSPTQVLAGLVVGAALAATVYLPVR